MIQRIQSVYLLVVTILLVVCLCTPVGSYIAADYSVSEFTNLSITSPDGVKDYAPWALFAILSVAALLAVVTIFLFKNRMLQIRLTIFSTILLVGYYATLITFIFMLKGENNTYSASWTVCLPAVAIILNWLAIRAIGKDEVLVKAYDRLR
jgi:ABC-type branched-subunit amino acid transport system permease subunit